MWCRPFVRALPSASTGGEAREVAVLVVDTQGMFDSETSQQLTASIFGLSTLLSRCAAVCRARAAAALLPRLPLGMCPSPQALTPRRPPVRRPARSHMVYNVDKRIQEDQLQHLALFTE